eukprot:CAMPEP_0203790250 /NCGR_PEP_ID=MMETSP0100_2-20121128/3938_1 /ASSEMBLY_ACC=CAM_ASM_000210 /TAXON_ID=96639 /ORGANISM=" , Strain NY0313808BC1" /LENGTH=234 /DNA_ID=CAMNT_0050693363 /DNA_START=580 /DNA_END=1284 /DNA_ORIENTATION=-
MTSFVRLISRSASLKEPILGEKRTKSPSSSDNQAMLSRALMTSAGETISMLAAFKLFDTNRVSQRGSPGLLRWYGTFVLKSFLYETVFDFFHYWTHRVCHEVPWLYRFHKSHHKFLHPSPLATFHQHPFDIAFTNILPNLLALSLLRRFTGVNFYGFEYTLLMSYKTFVEIAGHAGIESHATSFPQFAPLPKALNMELRSNDHDLHHSAPLKACNYSKRFTLWDKVFGTYIKSW